jgi:hypothetical protein
VSEELYDHSENDARSFDGQASEPVNLLGLGPDSTDPAHRAEADQLRRVLVAHFESDR